MCSESVGDPTSSSSGCVRASDHNGCIPASAFGNSTCLVLDANAQLCSSPTPYDITVRMTTSNVELDCNRQTIDHAYSRGGRRARGIVAPYTRSISNVKVKRCTIQDVGRYGADLKRHFRGAELDGAMVGHRNIVLEDVTIRQTGQIGIYVGMNSRDVMLNRVRLYDTYIGVYLEAGSVGTTITHSVIDGTYNREGISVDSSEHNTIEHTTIRGTSGAAIRFYTNCGELHGQVCPTLRELSASYNIVRHNHLYDEVEVGFRMGKLYFVDWCAAMPGGGRWRDRAHHNRFYGNTFHGEDLIIKDSDNVVYGNRFLGDAKLRVMGGFFAPPLITRIEASDNVFDRGEIELDIGDRGIVWPYTTSASAVVDAEFVNNRNLYGGCLYDETNTCSSGTPPRIFGAWVGITEFDGADLRAAARGMSAQWLGGWNYSGEERVEGVGRLKHTTRDSFLLRSPWGLGALARSGAYLYSAGAGRHGATYGRWTLRETDRIEAIADFDGDGLDEMFMATSSQGGLLGFDPGGGLRDLAQVTFGHWVGSWTRWWVVRAEAEVAGVGDFDGDGDEEMLMRDSIYGLGIMGYASGRFTAQARVPFDTNLGGYRVRSDVEVLGVADFDGDGADEIVVRSFDGVAFLEASGAGLRRITHAPWSGRFGSWSLNFLQEAVAAGDFDGDGRAELVLKDRREGLGFIELGASSAALVRRVPFGRRYGGWVLSASNEIASAGDADGDGDDDLLVSSGWGRGVLRAWGSTLTHLWMRGYGGLGPSAPTYNGATWPIASSDASPRVLDTDGDGVAELLLRR